MHRKQLIFTIAQSVFRLWPFSRGKQTVAHHLFQKALQDFQATVRLTRGKIIYELNLHDRIQAIFYLTGLYEAKTVQAACEILRGAKHPVFVDVGANVGLMSLQIKEQVPHAEIHLFEADPEIFACVKKNMEMNSLSQIFLNHLAVSSVSGQTLNFVRSPNSIESGWGRLENETNKTGQSQRVSVRTISIDQYLRDHQLDKVDVLKIDVEGAEESVLRGCAESFKGKKIKSIICEMHPSALQEFDSSTVKIRELLFQAGFQEKKKVDLNVLFQLPSTSS